MPVTERGTPLGKISELRVGYNGDGELLLILQGARERPADAGADSGLRKTCSNLTREQIVNAAVMLAQVASEMDDDR